MQRNFRLIIYASIVIRHTYVVLKEEPAEMICTVDCSTVGGEETL